MQDGQPSVCVCKGCGDVWSHKQTLLEAEGNGVDPDEAYHQFVEEHSPHTERPE